MPLDATPESAERILITGAGGFLGTRLVKALAIRPYRLFAFDSHRDLDITDRVAVDVAIERIKPTLVIHLAAISSPVEANRDPETTQLVNVAGTKNIAEAILRYVPDCRLLFASSGEVYGKTFNEVVAASESDPLRPEGVYARSKAAAEDALNQLGQSGLRSLSLRLFNFTGPGQRPDFVVPAFASQIASLEKRETPALLDIVVGNLAARRDFSDVDDVVRAFKLAVLSKDWNSASQLNISSGVARSIQSILDALLQRSSASISVRLDPERFRPNDVPQSAGNANKARTALGWVPIIPFDETIDEVLKYWRNHLSSDPA